MTPQVDWSAAGSEFTIYPAGTYRVQITDIERTESSKKKTPQLKWSADIIDPKQYRGQPISQFTVLTEAAMWKTVSMIHGCGIDTSLLPNMDTESKQFTEVLRKCVGSKLFWVIGEYEYDGKQRNSLEDMVRDPAQDVREIDVEADKTPDFLK